MDREKDKYLREFWEGEGSLSCFLKLLRRVVGKPVVACVDPKEGKACHKPWHWWSKDSYSLPGRLNMSESPSLTPALQDITAVFFVTLLGHLSELDGSCHRCLWTGGTGHVVAPGYQHRAAYPWEGCCADPYLSRGVQNWSSLHIACSVHNHRSRCELSLLLKIEKVGPSGGQSEAAGQFRIRWQTFVIAQCEHHVLIIADLVTLD